ncbi:MAG: ribonuclease P protein component [Muribaculaceae bacterium]|nr:ribonuclease P protein component [Muribaculaceae bacterium]MDE7393573.1 ribonuclease P protein component [Muribaculaceae bacterium]
MKQFTLKKEHKLTSTEAIERLFSGKQAGAEVQQALCFPLRAVWGESIGRPKGQLRHKFLISVPKKRLRHAVDRVAMRRRIREAYRLHHAQAEEISATDSRLPLDIAFIYVANEQRPYAAIERAMIQILSAIHPSAR